MRLIGRVVKLDRGFPLIRLENGNELRCEHATTIVKGEQNRAVIGDCVHVELPNDHDKGIIKDILPRKTRFVRRDPAERTASQVLAANFNLVMIMEPITLLNVRRLERELVLAHESGAQVAVILSKSDLCEQTNSALQKVCDLAGSSVVSLATSIFDTNSIKQVRNLIACSEIAILIGKSGVGKSSLVNALVGRKAQEVASVREYDGKGRHTTVDRIMIDIPSGGAIIDMPGVRELGLWDADQGLNLAFADIDKLAQSCRFRNCSHHNEPGCAVLAAIEAGELALTRLESYWSLTSESASIRQRRTEKNQMNGYKASNRKKSKH